MFRLFLLAIFRKFVKQVISYAEYDDTQYKNKIHKGPRLKLDVCIQWRNLQRYSRRMSFQLR